MTRNQGSFVVALSLLCAAVALGLAQVETRAAEAAPATRDRSTAATRWSMPESTLLGFMHIVGLPAGAGRPLTLYTPIAGCSRGSCTGCGFETAGDCLPVKTLGNCVPGIGCFIKVAAVTVVTVPIPDGGIDAGTDDGGTSAGLAPDAGTSAKAIVAVEGAGSSLRVGGAPLLIATGTFTRQRETSKPAINSSNRVQTLQAAHDQWTLVLAPRWQLEDGRWSEIKPGAHVYPPARVRFVKPALSTAEW
jgi:hypothetical protein